MVVTRCSSVRSVLSRLASVSTLSLGALLFDAGTASAAWPTQVLSAVEKNKALPDLNIEVTWDRLRRSGRITREWLQPSDGGLTPLDIKELRYGETTERLLVDLRVGIYHDLEFHLRAPIVLKQDSKIGFADDAVQSSTVFGSDNADNPNYGAPGDNNYRYPITEVPAARERSGFGDMTFGLAWSPFVDLKDEAYPTLTLRADVTAPTGKTRNPTDQSALPGGSDGSVGLGATTFDFSIALSKRMQVDSPGFDPYVIFGFAIPVPTPKQKNVGFDPPPVARFLVGSELVLNENAASQSRWALDFSFGVKYIGIGRTYSELSDYLPNFNQTLAPKNRASGSNVPEDVVNYSDYDNPANYATRVDGAACGRGTRNGVMTGIANVPCGELNRVDEHMLLEGAASINARPARYALFRMGVAYGLNTDHFLTTERVGKDTDAKDSTAACGGTSCAGRVNARNADGVDERSPYYDPRYDAPGRRFRLKQASNFTFFATAAALF